MARTLGYYIILVSFTTLFAKDPEPDLPPCPTNFQFLPQTLPMHCRMTSQPYPAPGLLPPQIPPFMPGPMPGKPVNPAVPSPANPSVPAPLPPPMPMGMGPPLPMGPMPMGMPGMPMGMPGMPMGMPMVGPAPQAKLPVIVMPFYSPDPAYKDPKKDPRSSSEPFKRKIRVIKRTRHRHDHDSDTDTDTDRSSDTDTSSDTDSNDSDRKYWNWKNRRSMRRRKKMKHTKKQEYLTPILQYVSKDGYVIFEKQISKGEAKDWLSESKGPNAETNNINEANNKLEKNGEETKPNRIVKSTRDNTGEADYKAVHKNNQRRQRKPRVKSQQGIVNNQE